MDVHELKEKINNLTIWKKRDERAPHKPLLILFALGQLQAKNLRLLPYEIVRVKLTTLLIECGPTRKNYRPAEPFVRLIRDGIWELDSNVNYKALNNKELFTHNVAGGFTLEVYRRLTGCKTPTSRIRK
ncbi:hypothetical protein GNT69_23060 [Bacillus sp. B15-48]|nr:hypothetical protein [Bacillus sp. B15-48]MBM4765119.1 hypothetical protein [Bacillus sp. B15-48]